MEKIIKVGLKSGSNWLFSAMHGDTIGGVESDFYVSIVFLTQSQFETFKKMIAKAGYNVQKSLTVANRQYGADYCCYLLK